MSQSLELLALMAIAIERKKKLIKKIIPRNHFGIEPRTAPVEFDRIKTTSQKFI